MNYWVACGIAPVAAPAGVSYGKNVLGRPQLGPCPPRGSAPQIDVFTLIATPVESGAPPPGMDKVAMLEALQGRQSAWRRELALRIIC